MWRNPKYPAPETPAPPVETGERLATFERGPGVELRVSLEHYETHPYVSLRLWEQGRDGAWWPTRKGSTVRLGEIRGLIDALGQLEGLAEPRRGATPSAGQGSPPNGPPRGRGPAQPRRARPLPGDDEPFNEFP